MYQAKEGWQFVHGTYIPPCDKNPNDALLMVIKNKETEEVKMQCLRNPRIKVWLTKPSMRNYEERIENIPLTAVDEYICSYKNLITEIAEHLGYRSGKFVNPRSILASPYVFGVDIDPLVRAKIEYQQTTPGLVNHLTFGTYDLECDITEKYGCGILCSSFVDWYRKEAYCHVDARWYDPQDGWEEKIMALFEEKKQFAYSQMNEKAKKLFEPEKWKVKFVMCKNERELIQKTWETIHRSKVLFLGIWNMSYDIPKTIERAQFNQLNLEDLFSSPDVPPEWRHFAFFEDTRKHEHYTDAWSFCSMSAYCWILDLMCLYSRTRKVKGRESSYTLTYISNKISGIGKIGLEDTGDHFTMQTKYKPQYCVYNVFDSIITALINAMTDDISGMLATQGPSLIRDLNKQTVSLTHQFYKYCLEHNQVPGSAGRVLMKGPYDDAIGNVGGAVLDSNKLKIKGWPCIQEYPDGTWLRKLCCDIDVSSFYPSMDIAGNMSRATKLSTVIWVEGSPFAVEDILSAGSDNEQEMMRKKNAEYIDTLFGKIPYVSENCVSVSHDYFNLFSYSDALDLYEAERQKAMNNQHL